MAAVTAGVVMAVAAVGSAYSQNKAAKQQARAQRLEQRRADVANARERRATVRAARVARAQIEAQASTSGLGGSSVTSGAVSNVQSTASANLGWLNFNQQVSSQVSQANIAAARWMSRANNWQALGSLAQQVGGSFGNQGGGASSGGTT
jgi:hypothetical protein